ncbi:MAG: hypothetical protein OEZ38_05275, partial [Gammaproteobacteria bacterium]|nr:hypothetical protein [Gammaproteobacteria bacterium]
MMFLFVYIYSALVLIRPHEYLPQLKDVPILPFILIMGAIIWIVYGRKSFHISQNKLIIIFLVILSLSPLFQGWPGGISIAFTKFYPIAIFYLILVSALDTSKRITKFYWLMCVAAVIFAVHGIDQTNNGVGWTGVSPVMDGRITYVGIFNDPNDLGNYFVATLPIIIYLFSASRSYLSRLTLSLSMGFVLYGIYLTNSRGAVLGVAGMLWVYLASKYGFIKAILVSMLFSPLFLFGPSRITEIHPTEESAAGRVDAWYAGLEMLKNS